MLIDVISKLSDWLETNKQIKCNKLPYHIEYGGVFMKDTAVLAGLGCMGKSNILVTPDFGPRVRLRVMALNVDLPSTGPIDFDPCADCDAYCRKACPQNVFKEKVLHSEDYDQTSLPGRTGVYDRNKCNLQMEMDRHAGKQVLVGDSNQMGMQVKFCRRCEWACPVGKKVLP